LIASFAFFLFENAPFHFILAALIRWGGGEFFECCDLPLTGGSKFIVPGVALPKVRPFDPAP